MKQLQRFSFNGLVILSLMALTGCVPLIIGAAAGAGGISYARGAMTKNIDSTVSEVHEASLAALKAMNLFVIDDELNRRSAVINGEYEDGQKIKIVVDAQTEYVSKVTIRIGTFGDQEESQYILNAIEKQL